MSSRHLTDSFRDDHRLTYGVRKSGSGTARPHRARGTTPATAYAATLKAIPAGHTDRAHYRVRNDHVDTNGKISLRHAGRMHHLGIGATHRGKRCIIIADQHTITVVHHDTGEIIATNTINPDKTYWRNNKKEPGRWPDSSPR